MNIGDSAIGFRLKDVDGSAKGLDTFASKKVLAIIFSCNHCPYVLAWEDRIMQIQRDYEDRDVQLLLINANDPVKYPADSFGEMQARAEARSYPFPYLHDETQETAHAYGAQRTPEVFLFGPDRKLAYHGTIDDDYEQPKQVANHYLRDAIEALLNGEPPSVSETPAVGCTIKWK